MDEKERTASEKLGELLEWLTVIKGRGLFSASNDCDNETAEAYLYVIERVLSGDSTSPCESEKVLISLREETFGWGETGIHGKEIFLWKKEGFTPEEARKWIGSGLTLRDAYLWGRGWTPEKVLRWKKFDFSPIDAGVCDKRGIAPEKATEWKEREGPSLWETMRWVEEFPFATKQELQRLMESVEGISEAINWRDNGFSVEEILLYQTHGVSLKKAVAHKRHEGKGKGNRQEFWFDSRGAVDSLRWKKLLRRASAHGWSLTHLKKERSVDCTYATFEKSERKVLVVFKNGAFVESVADDRYAMLSFASLLAYMKETGKITSLSSELR